MSLHTTSLSQQYSSSNKLHPNLDKQNVLLGCRLVTVISIPWQEARGNLFWRLEMLKLLVSPLIFFDQIMWCSMWVYHPPPTWCVPNPWLTGRRCMCHRWSQYVLTFYRALWGYLHQSLHISLVCSASYSAETFHSPGWHLHRLVVY